ncbi:MAG: glutathione S-transferase family protein [Rhizobiales bacterium]|nr:glutathione S-transferase family protein [Hyphomicrobiales bacterium]
MMKLLQFPLCPFSRRARMTMDEYNISYELLEEHPWAWNEEFLSLNPAAELPVLVENKNVVLCGIVPITEYFNETTVKSSASHVSLFRGSAVERAEVRRLVEWFDIKFNREVTELIITEKVYKRFITASEGGGSPDMEIIRVGKQNLNYHMQYIDHLLIDRHWLAGEYMSQADFAAAAHLSCLDYTSDVPWKEFLQVKEWYVRIKSRPSFRGILEDKMLGFHPVPRYADLDF